MVRYNENKSELHNYFVQVKETYKDKEKKYSFKCTQFGLRRNSDIFVKGDRVKINGFLKVNIFVKFKGGDKLEKAVAKISSQC